MKKEIQVLFLDDEESIVEGMERLFRRESFGVFATTKVNEARATLEKENIKVVVSDQRMPDIQGVKFLQEVRDKHPDTVRILFTGYTDFSAAEEAINVGEVYRFISKPWKTAELLSTIRQSIEYYELLIENKKLFEETKARKDELEVANEKLQGLYEVQKDFTSTVSHELRTPLSSIKTAIDLVVKRTIGEINKDQDEVLARAKRNVDRLKLLIDDILDLTKMESGKLKMTFVKNDINNFIREVADSQKDVAVSRGIYLKSELDEDISHVAFDSNRMVQVLNNLLSNAIKFTKEGGVTIISQNKQEENHILVSVKDTGLGIAEDDLFRVFDKFQQIESPEKNQEGGTGLGLAICREIISRHGGKIWVESKLGEGTSFNFILPLEESKEDQS